MTANRLTWVWILFSWWTPAELVRAAGVNPRTQKECVNCPPKSRNCFVLIPGLTEVTYQPLRVSVPGRPGQVVTNHAVKLQRRKLGELTVEVRNVVQGRNDLPTSIMRNGNHLELSYPLPKGVPGTPRVQRSTSRQNVRVNESALEMLDEGREANARFALAKEHERRDFPQSIFAELTEAAEEHWDATQITVWGPERDIWGGVRFASSGPDRRLLPFPETLEKLLKSNRGKWRLGAVDPSLTRTLIVEKALRTQLLRPILDLPGGFALPSGEVIDFLVGEASEIGALAIKEEVNPKVFNAITQEMFRHVFSTRHSREYNENGQIFYAWGEKTGIRLHRRFGWEVTDPDRPFLLDAPEGSQEEKQKWWVIRHTPQSLRKWIDGLAMKPDFSQQDVARLRRLFAGLSDAGLTDLQRNIWEKYYTYNRTQRDIAAELGYQPSAIFNILSAANEKIEIRLGVRMPNNLFSVRDIFASANTPERRTQLIKAVGEARLGRREKQAVAGARAGESHEDIAERLGIARSAVTRHLIRAKQKIEKALQGAFPIEKAPELKVSPLLQALAPRKGREPKAIATRRELLPRVALTPWQITILNKLREGMSPADVASEKGIQEVAVWNQIYQVDRKIDEAAKRGNPEASVWERLLSPEEKARLEKATADVLPFVTSDQRRVWRLGREEGKKEADIAVELGVQSPIVYRLQALVRKKIEAAYRGQWTPLLEALKGGTRISEKSVGLRRALASRELAPLEKKIVAKLRGGTPLDRLADKLGESEKTVSRALRQLEQELTAEAEKELAQKNKQEEKQKIWGDQDESALARRRQAVERVLAVSTAPERAVGRDYFGGKLTGEEIAKRRGLKAPGVRALIRRLRKKVEIEMGARPQATLYSWETIRQSADNAEKEAILNAAVSAATRYLERDEQKIWKLKSGRGWSESKISRQTGISQSRVNKVLQGIREEVLKQVANRFEVQEKGVEGEYWNFLQALRTEPRPGEAEEISRTRTALFQSALTRKQVDFLSQVRDGRSFAEAARQQGLTENDLRYSLRYLDQKIDEYWGRANQRGKAPRRPSLWNRLLPPLEKQRVEELAEGVLAELDSGHRKVWRLYYKEGMSIEAAAENLGRPESEVQSRVNTIKKRIERLVP